MEVGRIKDPLYEDYHVGIFHLASSHLFRPPITWGRGFAGLAFRVWGFGVELQRFVGLHKGCAPG